MFWGYSIESKETNIFQIEMKRKVESIAMKIRIQI